MPRAGLRLPIGVKLALVAAGLVSVLTGAFIVLGYRTVTTLYETQADRLRESRVHALELRSVSVAQHLGETAREALAGSETGRLYRALGAVAGHDAEIHHAAIADESGRLLVRSDESPAQTLARGERLDVTPGGMTVDEADLGGVRVRRMTLPIRGPDGSGVLGYLTMAWSLAGLQRDLAAIADERDLELRRATEILLVAAGLSIAFGVLVAGASSTVLTRPIRRLAETARALSRGDLNARSEVESRDELGELATTMNTMADHIGELMEKTRAHAEVARELAVARRIQSEMNPGVEVQHVTGLDVIGRVEAASDCGGDFWALMPLTRQRTLVLVGDVAGHGLSSAMLTATAKSCLETIRHLTRGDLRVGHVLRLMDQLVRESIGPGYFLTCFASSFDPIEGTLTYANAGHPPPFLIRRSEERWRIGRLTSRGNRLGDADGFAFVEHTLRTERGDLLCWYSDGLTDAQDGDGSPYGARRVRELLAKHAAETPAEVLAALFGGLDAHRRGAPLDDDITAVVGRVMG
jgi:sigma-B regulation protein RsbU (phosphoserine phosphatase)